jgi:hypothetical protein
LAGRSGGPKETPSMQTPNKKKEIRNINDAMVNKT